MTEVTGKTSSILNLVNQTIELPTLPEVLIKLNSIIADPEASAEDVAKVIETDPAVATNILRIVNSAYYGLQVKVASVSLAISIMGFTMTKKVALRAAVFSSFGQKAKTGATSQHFDLSRFWRHSVFTAIAARTFGAESEAFPSTNVEDLYVCGLLHDIGKIILLENHCEAYLGVLDRVAQSGQPEIDVESEMLGFSHADVGSVLAVKWFLPEDLAVAIRFHHQPDRNSNHRPLSSLIHLADRIAWNAGFPSTQGLREPPLDIDVYEHAGLDPEHVAELVPKIAAEFEGTEMPW